MTAEAALRNVAGDLDAMGARWALIGGWAVSARTTPRFTQDLDFAVAVASDREAEDVVYRLCSRGYSLTAGLEQDYVHRLSGVRLAHVGSGVAVDLLFASSGIEYEVVTGAEHLGVVPGVVVPVATAGHLIALKVLAGRGQDRADLRSLIAAAAPADLEDAREAARLIQARGFSRGADVPADLERYIAAVLDEEDR